MQGTFELFATEKASQATPRSTSLYFFCFRKQDLPMMYTNDVILSSFASCSSNNVLKIHYHMSL